MKSSNFKYSEPASSAVSQPALAMNLMDMRIDDLSKALSNGSLTSTELVAKYLHRIAKYDWNGLCLNSIPLLNLKVFQEAAASDDRRAAGVPAGPLEGIPYTIKDNFAVAGMTAAAGSPAFSSLRPKHSAFVADQLCQAGAVLMGKTNMPPMARGGMQRGVYGRAESPYNTEYLTAAFSSGSSNGSATSTSASFAAFGLGTETVSSGRSPASNNALVAYTPSRGVISLQGVWPLYAICDVVTPHTRCMEDMYQILSVLTTPDPSTKGDFWREQNSVPLPRISQIEQPNLQCSRKASSVFAGKRIGVPKAFIGKSDSASTGVNMAQSVLALWERARADLEGMGATIVETDFPALSSYEAVYKFDLPQCLEDCPPGWTTFEQEDLLALTWQQFLNWAEDPNYTSLEAVNPELIFPLPKDYLPHKFDNIKHMPYEDLIRIPGQATAETILGSIDVKKGLSALETQRKRNFEDWMDSCELDVVAFPANGDVGRADIETNVNSAREGLRSGVKYSHGNRMLRHLGVPSVSVSMGLMSDTKMPVNLTFIGKAYKDDELLKYAYAYERCTCRRVPPPLTPALPSDAITAGTTIPTFTKERVNLKVALCEPVKVTEGEWSLHIMGTTKVQTSDLGGVQIEIFVNGEQVDQGKTLSDKYGCWKAMINGLKFGNLDRNSNQHLHDMVVILARSREYRISGDLILIDTRNLLL